VIEIIARIERADKMRLLRRACVLNYHDAAVTNADGSDMHALVDDSALEVGVPAWSADGLWLVFYAAAIDEMD